MSALCPPDVIHVINDPGFLFFLVALPPLCSIYCQDKLNNKKLGRPQNGGRDEGGCACVW